MAVLDALPTTDLPGRLTSRPYRVTSVRHQTHDIVTIDVMPQQYPIAFEPGQFDMVYVYGVGEAAISISSDPATPGLLSHTIRAVGWVTKALNDLQPGTTIGIRGPYGRPWPMAEAEGKDLVIVAGGIGLAPVRPAIVQALRQRERFGRIVVLVGARSPRDLVFRDDLDRWHRDAGIDVHITVDSAVRGWSGRVGVVTRLIPRVPFDPEHAVVLTCGPEVMMWHAAQALLARGVPAERVYVTLERNMRCGVGTCGHCQLGPVFLCRDGPVFTWPEVAELLDVREL
ncbi:MAG: FAD/NAD(P)-binding protein [Nitriliruptoraceae bacterium]